jgi:hypothetical protein
VTGINVEFDFSEVHQFTVELENATADVMKNVKKAVSTSAYRGRQAWIRSARRRAGTHLPGYPTSVDYDSVKFIDGSAETELGPNLSRNQGPLGIVEDAPGGVNATPQRNYEAAERVIEQDLVSGILIAIGDGIGDS